MNDDLTLAPELPIQVLVVAAYPSLRAGLRAMLAGVEGIEVWGERGLPPAGPVGEPPPFDVLVTDVGEDAGGAAQELDALFPGLPTVLLGDWAGDSSVGAPANAARGYLERDASGAELAAAVRAVAAGLTVFDPAVAARLVHSHPGPPAAGGPDGTLTEREREVLELLAQGLPNKGIALRLGISEHTAKFHVGTILSKLGAESRTEAVMLAARRGLLPL